MARSHDSPDDDITHSLTQWIPFTWIYWRQQVQTSLTRTMGLLRYVHTQGDLKLQNKCDDGMMSKVSRSKTLQWDQLIHWNNCYSFYFKIGFENDPRIFSSLSIFRTLQTKVQTSNVWIVIMLQLLIKLKSLMSLNFPDEHKSRGHDTTYWCTGPWVYG